VAALRALGIHVRTIERSSQRSLLRTGLALGGGRPLQVAYYDSRRMAQAARSAEGAGFDVVLAQMIRMAPYGLLVPARFRVMLLVDSLGLALTRRAAHEPPWRRPLVLLERDRVARYEREMTARYDEAWLVSGEDRDALPAELHERIRIVPNGFPPEFLAVPLRRPGTDTLLFVGHLGVPHNVDSALTLARDVLPRVRATRPAARLRLVGAEPAPRVRALAAMPGVDVLGFVPDLAAEFAGADVFVAPLRFASGVQNKLLEAMAAGVPVVTSAFGARGLGLPADGGDLVVAAEGTAEFTRVVLDVLDDPGLADARAARARTWVREVFRWANARDAVAQIGSRLAAAGQSATDAGHASTIGPPDS
jgi:polysaccharide biosynthesis protein PslH